ncbi:hypothetical protein P8631_05580 [Guyparkeria sp. 1SP6A2]|nr:hypothetical protein [Guyparkeria sp. 1SP6A2]
MPIFPRTAKAALVGALVLGGIADAAELTGRASILGAVAWPQAGDIGDDGQDRLTADQQSLRLMLDGTTPTGQWSTHIKARRVHRDGWDDGGPVSADLFRWRPLAEDWVDGDDHASTRLGYEVDRAVYRRRFDQVTVGVGRQPIDWGLGRLWQPMNVFGAFAPTDLDTDYKSGIDAAVVDWYPSPVSSLTLAYVLSPQGDPGDRDEALDDGTEDSTALYYRRQVGMQSELAALAGRIRGENVLGAAFQGDWHGMGWRLEGVRHRINSNDDAALFWVAGLDYRLAGGTLLTAEWYQHDDGANRSTALADVGQSPRALAGLQPHLGERVLGLSADQDLTPLLHGSYLLLISPLRGPDDSRQVSLLHQVNLNYSIGNETDLLLSLQHASGRGLAAAGRPRSEFGHLPTGITLRLRHYF